MRQWTKYIDAVRTIQSHGISVNGCFVIGLDGHGPEIFGDVEHSVREAGLHEVQITVQTPFPGTPLWRRLRREGRLIHEGDWSRCTLFDVAFRPLRMTADELRDGFRALMVRLYSADFTRWRREQFRKQLRLSRSGEVPA